MCVFSKTHTGRLALSTRKESGMRAQGMKQVSGVYAVAKREVTRGDAVWLNAVRNSPISRTQLYQTTKSKVLATFAGSQVAFV